MDFYIERSGVQSSTGQFRLMDFHSWLSILASPTCHIKYLENADNEIVATSLGLLDFEAGLLHPA